MILFQTLQEPWDQSRPSEHAPRVSFLSLSWINAAEPKTVWTHNLRRTAFLQRHLCPIWDYAWIFLIQGLTRLIYHCSKVCETRYEAASSGNWPRHLLWLMNINGMDASPFPRRQSYTFNCFEATVLQHNGHTTMLQNQNEELLNINKIKDGLLHRSNVSREIFLMETGQTKTGGGIIKPEALVLCAYQSDITGAGIWGHSSRQCRSGSLTFAVVRWALNTYKPCYIILIKSF